ncbi:hypothetical protein GZ77_20995 [Endozoicomonas montiporae]|uniref:Methyltransferase domain-containing protein n=2 Tax=Endozoicomonas montiporae TaxID=1027273 RepID=A0A081N391_9GAMM|nr:methyltransferase domain-containing protein [Endozoicomonas montiporae]AMO58207.1 hypothetical protein EZMO1_4289 [Endozoicomonas montiporae CL-33]KEQ12914.1 hypothetical protein GZ77_20995 [Endozoicomonas montiporae]
MGVFLSGSFWGGGYSVRSSFDLKAKTVKVESGQQIAQPAALSEARYAETFGLLVRVSREYEPMKQALIRTISRYCPESFSLLDIGAGRGIFIGDVLSELFRRPDLYGAYESNPDHFQALQAKSPELARQQSVWREAFTSETVLKPEWDVVLMSHSLYWMQPMGLHVQAALAGLKPGGVLVIFLQPPAGFYKLQLDFMDLMVCRDNGLNNHASSQELMAELKALNIDATEELLPGYLDFSDIWDDDRALLDMGCFILGGELREVPEWIQKKMVHHIQANTLQLDRFKLFNQPTSMVIVQKS